MDKLLKQSRKLQKIKMLKFVSKLKRLGLPTIYLLGYKKDIKLKKKLK